MVFEKSFENNYNDLSQPTKYRFAELEIAKAIPTLSNLFSYQYQPKLYTINYLYLAVVPPHQQVEQEQADFEALLYSTNFNKPLKKELIHYLIASGHTYTSIRKLTKASFNTIADMRFGIPVYHPLFRYWTPESLDRWNQLKRSLNIFDEPLAHLKMHK